MQLKYKNLENTSEIKKMFLYNKENGICGRQEEKGEEWGYQSDRHTYCSSKL